MDDTVLGKNQQSPCLHMFYSVVIIYLFIYLFIYSFTYNQLVSLACEEDIKLS
jgi:hypothetical protein